MSLADLAAGEASAAAAERERDRVEREESRRREAFAAVSAVLTRRDGQRVPPGQVGMKPINSGLPDDTYGWGDDDGVGLVARLVGGQWAVVVARRTGSAWTVSGQQVHDLVTLAAALGTLGP